jgi:putative oxidoreductase
MARLFISLVFIGGALHKIFDWHESEKLLLANFADWQGYIGFWENGQSMISFLIPWAPLLLVLATALEFIGGLLVLLGIKEKLGATLLILSLIPITIVMHPFWFVEDPSRYEQMINFFKNLAILGGLMMILLRDDQYAESDPMNFGN